MKDLTGIFHSNCRRRRKAKRTESASVSPYVGAYNLYRVGAVCRITRLTTAFVGLAVFAVWIDRAVAQTPPATVKEGRAPEARSQLTYPFSAIVPTDQWRLTSDGDRGSSRLEGARLTLDFSRGARSLGVGFPDRTLPGAIDRIRIKVSGEPKEDEAHLFLRTHFMTFHKRLGRLAGGEQELVTDGPPGAGWEWHGGENDGKIHGPLRLAELRFEANDAKGNGSLEISRIEFEAHSPADRQVLMTARTSNQSDPVQFDCDLRAFSDRAVAGTLRWTIKTWDGAALASGERQIELQPNLVAKTISVPSPSRPAGCRFLEAEFQFEAAGQKVVPVQAYWLAALESQPDFALRPDSAFGMGVYLGRFGDAEMEKVARLAGEAGVKWSREDFSWQRIEPRRGEFHWDYYDRLLERAHRYGITVYAIVGYWTDWTKPYTPEGVEDYVRFVRALVAHYKDRIHQWEIWNEPNIFFWQGPKELYAELLTKSFLAIKETDPQAQVLGISTAGIDFKFIDQMLAKHAPFDVLTIHPYRRLLSEGEFIADLKKASNQVKLADGTRRPVWITEMGWATHVPHHVLKQDFEANTQRAQAELIARTYLSTIISGVEPRTFWYDFRNDGDDPVYFEHNMGIVQRDGRPKPAYIAFATMARLLNEMRFVGARDDWPGVYSCEFTSTGSGGGRVLALWRTGSDGEIEIPLPSGKAVWMNTVGERRPVSATGGKCKLALRSNSPGYLLLPRSSQ
ncbi:MAG TPA: beta-galactosidase [Verrucomicrobiae bacterium]